MDVMLSRAVGPLNRFGYAAQLSPPGTRSATT